MKKLIVLAFALILVVALCACNGGNGDDTTTAATGAVTEADSTTAENEDDATESGSATVTTESNTDPANTETDPANTETDPANTETTPVDSGDDTETIAPDDNNGVADERDNWEYSEYENLFITGVELADGTEYTTQAQKIMPGKSVATKFTVTKGALSSIGLGCPSWNDAKGSLTLTLYAWVEGEGTTEQKALKDGYTKTVAAEPIYSETFVDFADNTTLRIYFDDPDAGPILPVGGTYLLVVSNPDTDDFEVGYAKSTFINRDYYTKRGETVTYNLPTDDDIKAAGYDPKFTTDIVSFNAVGAPQYGSYLNAHIDVMFDPTVYPELLG